MGQVQAVQSDLFPEVVFTSSERAVFRKVEKQMVADWAEDHVVVTLGAHPGPWRNATTPYLAGIMNAFGDSHVREIVICAAPQTGKTSVTYNCLAYVAKNRPGMALIVMPDENACKRVSKKRIQPLFEKTPCLSELMTGHAQDFTTLAIQLKNGMSVEMVWSHSPSALSSMPIEFLFCDEVDKYPAFVGDEADPLSLAEDRMTTYQYTSKLFVVSTPTTEANFVWSRLNDCVEIRDYHVPCPLCGAMQIMSDEQIKWPGEVQDPKRIKSERLAYYECPHCTGHWSDMDRDRAVGNGEWAARQVHEAPYSVGFHLPSWYSPFVSLSTVAAAKIKAAQSKARERHYYNSHRAEPWVDITVSRAEDQILALCDDRPRGLVPRDTAALIMTIDTQQRGFYYEVRAWGFGESPESWQVREGYVVSWSDLEDIIYRSEYRDSEGVVYGIRCGFIDSGGTRALNSKHSRTAEVYAWCKKNPKIRPIKGMQKQTAPWKTSLLDHYPDGSAIQGGLKLYTLDVNHYKDELARLLAIEPTDPGAWHLHRETTQQYAAHMCVEYRDDRGLWMCPRGKRNDFWDCAVYQVAAHDVFGIQYLRREKKENKKASGKKYGVISRGLEDE